MTQKSCDQQEIERLDTALHAAQEEAAARTSLCHQYQQQAADGGRIRAELEEEIALLKGALAADAETNRVEGARVGIEMGCDTAHWMAEEILGLRAHVARLKVAVKEAGELLRRADALLDRAVAEKAAALREGFMAATRYAGFNGNHDFVDGGPLKGWCARDGCERAEGASIHRTPESTFKAWLQTRPEKTTEATDLTSERRLGDLRGSLVDVLQMGEGVSKDEQIIAAAKDAYDGRETAAMELATREREAFKAAMNAAENNSDCPTGEWVFTLEAAVFEHLCADAFAAARAQRKAKG